MSHDNVPPPYRPVGGQMPSTVYSGPPPRTWENAPKVVKSWAYPLSWLGIIGLPIILLVNLAKAEDVIAKVILIVVFGLFFILQIWLNRALRAGKQAAWTVQMVMSILGLIGFPIGTLINGVILASWFKPETKEWFGAR